MTVRSILMAKRRLPAPVEIGTDVVTHTLLCALCQEFAVTMVAVDEGVRSREGARELRERGVEVDLVPEDPVGIRHRPIIGKITLNLTRLLGGVPRAYQLEGCDGLGLAIEARTRERPFHLAQLEYWTLARYGRLARCPTALLNHDVWFHTARGNARYAPTWRERTVWSLEAATTRRYESSAQGDVDWPLFLSEDDRALMSRHGPVGDRGRVVPVLFPFTPADRPSTAPDRDPTVLFLGAMNAPFNVDAVTSFVREGWPVIQRAVPGARFVVAGRFPTARVRELAATPGVEVTGYVPDLSVLFSRAHVAVSPSRFGTGIKVKVAQALAAGLPVVGTPAGLSGYEDAPGVVREDDRQALAPHVIEILTDPVLRRRMASAAREHYHDRLWLETGRPRVLAFYEHLLT